MLCLLGFQVVFAGIGLWWMLAKRLEAWHLYEDTPMPAPKS